MTWWKGFLVVGFAFLSFFLVKTLFKEVSTENLAIYVNDKYQSGFPKRAKLCFNEQFVIQMLKHLGIMILGV